MMGVVVMVREKYAVRLTPEERENLQRLVRGGKSPARMTTRARILLKTGDGWSAPRWPKPSMWRRARHHALEFRGGAPRLRARAGRLRPATSAPGRRAVPLSQAAAPGQDPQDTDGHEDTAVFFMWTSRPG